MSDFDLRDWAVGDRITAASQQAVTDHLRRVSPLSFSGNVQVRGSPKQGLAVYVPPSPGASPAMPLLHITGAATGDGQYIAREVILPDTWDSTTPLNLSTLVDGDTDVLFINGQENNGGTHWLTDPANTDQVYLTPDARWPVTDEEGRTVYYSNNIWVSTCTPDTGGGTDGADGHSIEIFESSTDPAGAEVGDEWIVIE